MAQLPWAKERSKWGPEEAQAPLQCSLGEGVLKGLHSDNHRSGEQGKELTPPPSSTG